MKILTALFLIISLKVFSQKSDSDLGLISSIIDKQEIAWNNGSLEEFMTPYWHSDSLLFIGKNGVKKGWQTTLDNYKKSYPSKEAMGSLRFNIVKMEKLGENVVFVIGKWALERREGNVSGHFTLLWKKIDGNWVIVADHSS